MRKTAAASALLVAALGFAAGATGSAQADQNDAVNYTATNTEKSTIIRTDAGSLSVDNGVFKITAANGAVLGGTELNFRVDDFVFPINADISDRTATLTPQLDLEHAVYKPVALPFENSAPWKTDYEREQAAWNRMATTISMGATIGTLGGGIAGAALGCVIGAGVGFVATTPLLLMFGAGPLGGCLVGASLVGFIGTVAGQIFVTAPFAILAAAQYFTTIAQPSLAK